MEQVSVCYVQQTNFDIDASRRYYVVTLSDMEATQCHILILFHIVQLLECNCVCGYEGVVNHKLQV